MRQSGNIYFVLTCVRKKYQYKERSTWQPLSFQHCLFSFLRSWYSNVCKENPDQNFCQCTQGVGAIANYNAEVSMCCCCCRCLRYFLCRCYCCWHVDTRFNFLKRVHSCGYVYKANAGKGNACSLSILLGIVRCARLLCGSCFNPIRYFPWWPACCFWTYLASRSSMFAFFWVQIMQSFAAAARGRAQIPVF